MKKMAMAAAGQEFVFTAEVAGSPTSFSVYLLSVLLLFAGTAVLVELPGIVIGCGCVSGIVICKHLARYQGERMQVHLLQGSH